MIISVNITSKHFNIFITCLLYFIFYLKKIMLVFGYRLYSFDSALRPVGSVMAPLCDAIDCFTFVARIL